MVTKEQVYEALQDCYDPEIPVSIWAWFMRSK